ncbi:MAG: 3-oxoacid CoA-transferase subunit A [Imperialibacter sp.]|uniref:CoA transferase subunit A n=1 Tax=Imperialibacter sp. TaxID=2038411 RepID=UPI0032EABD91
MHLFDKVTDFATAQSAFFDGMTLLFGGFGGVGTPPGLIDCLIDSGVKDVKLIGNDAGFPWIGIGKFVCLERATHLLASHIGSNPTAGDLMNQGKLQVEFSPQGILVERIRSGGVGLNGFLTELSKGTQLEYDKPKVNIGGKEYIYEAPVTGDVGIVYAKKADTFGNLIFDKTARNTNPYVAMASKVTIVEADEIVPMGALAPEEIVVPGIFVKYIVQSKGYNWKWVWETKDK